MTAPAPTPDPVTLDRVVEVARRSGAADLDGDGSTPVARTSHDSRAVVPGDLFCCIPGAVSDGHDHAPAAVVAGAAALLCERPLGLGVPEVRVPSVRRALGPVAAVVAGEPSRRLQVLGITGTNGKTTVVHLLGAVLAEAGRRTVTVGTLTGARTTPEAPELQTQLARAAAEGVEVVAMEVSSHALDQHRVDGTRFAVAGFTNLSPDHLDHHGTMERYFAAKARLFTPELADRAVVVTDDPHGRLLVDSAVIPTTGVGLDAAEGLVLVGCRQPLHAGGAGPSSCPWPGASTCATPCSPPRWRWPPGWRPTSWPAAWAARRRSPAASSRWTPGRPSPSWSTTPTPPTGWPRSSRPCREVGGGSPDRRVRVRRRPRRGQAAAHGRGRGGGRPGRGHVG